ncbi:MAG: DUF4126 domain-containing protein [Verrucomicrobiota bacterium]|nr:DUF4126 domain-containing protein [Verrucomicrobiota bacterium]
MNVETILSVFIGIGLSAACGFRIFIPLLILSGASLFGGFELFESVAWLGSWPVFVCLCVATLSEILAYYIPWLDNLLDSVASPMAVLAGVLVSYSVLSNVPPWAHWALAIIAGGGTAGLIQLGSVQTRLLSTATTGGIANPLISTLESIGAVVMSFVAIFLPVIAMILFFLLLVGVYYSFKLTKSIVGKILKTNQASG